MAGGPGVQGSGAARDVGGSSGPRSGRRPPGTGLPDTLRALYQRYCEVEARELLPLLPREGVRALWASIRAGDAPHPHGDTEPLRAHGTTDALDRLAAEALRLLPLPPYEVWVRAWMADRAPFLERMGVPAAPAGPEPVTVATREVDHRWWAHLNLYRTDDGRWRGFLSFHAQGEPRTLRTAEVFRGDDPAELRRRFRQFTPLSLQAFLRSVLP